MADTIDELVEMADADGPLAVVAIDIPIGLPDRGRRQAEVLARKAVVNIHVVGQVMGSGAVWEV